MVMINCNRTWCRLIWSVIILVIKQIGTPATRSPILLIAHMITDQIESPQSYDHYKFHSKKRYHTHRSVIHAISIFRVKFTLAFTS